MSRKDPGRTPRAGKRQSVNAFDPALTPLEWTDLDALLPASNPPPVATVVLDTLRSAIRTPGLAIVAI